ncbi:MAG: DNA-binding NarL/FixJ family response regulator [Saprospiraceae bacterium]|jgi:DNA-binding NarL/FixJ family response regulator
METIKVLLVDDHHIIRHGLKLLFLSEESIEVVGEAGSGNEAIAFLQGNKEVDVIISDVTMDDMDGITMVKHVTKKFGINVMMLTMHLDEKYITEAMSSGAKGYLVKDSSEKDIIEAVKSVSRGEIYLTKTVSDVLAKSLLRKSHNKSVEQEMSLTRREKEILGYIVEGLNNRKIGAKLDISERTVNAHRYNMMKKLKANNTADLVRISLRYNLAG